MFDLINELEKNKTYLGILIGMLVGLTSKPIYIFIPTSLSHETNTLHTQGSLGETSKNVSTSKNILNSNVFAKKNPILKIDFDDGIMVDPGRDE